MVKNMSKDFVQFVFLLVMLTSSVSFGLIDYEVTPIQIDGGGAIQYVEVSPHDPDMVLACVDVAGMACSFDGGQTWKMSNTGLNRREYFSVADAQFAPSKPGWIYMASGRSWGKDRYIGRLFVSKDNGSTWEGVSENMSFSGQWVIRQWGNIILVDPEDHLHVMVGTVFQGVLESFDGGKTFKALGPEKIGVINVLIRSPKNPDEIYVAANKGISKGHGPVDAEFGVWKSSDNGKSWGRLLDANVFSLAISSNGQMIAAAQEDVYYSVDDGASWKKLEIEAESKIEGLQYRWWAVGADPRKAGRFIVASMTYPEYFAHPKIFAKENGCDKLKPIGEISRKGRFTDVDLATIYEPYGKPGVDGWQGRLSWFGPATSSIVFHPTRKDVVYLSDWYTVNRSLDNGKTWKAHSKGLYTTVPVKVVFDSVEDGHFYIGLVDVGFHEGWLDGKKFRCRSLRDSISGSHGSPAQFTFNGDVITFAAVSTYEGGAWIHRKVNKGPWQKVYDDFYKGKRVGTHEIFIEMHPELGVLFSKVVNGTILISNDLGKTWSQYADDVITAELQKKGKVSCPVYKNGKWQITVAGAGYIAEELGKWQSSDAGLWESVEGYGDVVFELKQELDKNHRCELHKSTDAGKSWEKIHAFYKQQSCKLVLTSSPDVFYVYNNPYNGYQLWKTSDGGETWETITAVPGYKLQSICPDPQDPHRVVIGSHGLGNYLLELKK